MAEIDKEEELQEYALYEANICQLTDYIRFDILYLQEISLPKELLPMLSKQRQMWLIL